MQIIPEIVTALTLLHLRAEWQPEQSERIYARMVQRAPKHLLVRLQGRLDLSQIEADCAGYQHPGGPGVKASYSIGQYVRALLVKYLYGWSYRETEEHMAYDLMVKWFVGLAVQEEGMDHSAICLFEQWVDRTQQRSYFDRSLEQINGDFAPEHLQVQIGDTYAMHANAAQESLIRLLRHTSRLLLEEMEHDAPEVYVLVLAQVDGEALWGSAQEVHAHWLSEEAYQQRRVRTAQAAWALQRAVQTHLSELPQKVKPRVQLREEDLAKILSDEFHLPSAGAAPSEPLVERDEKHKGTYRQCSATDPDATCRNHGGEKVLGYNVSLLVTLQGIIQEILAASGCEPDAVGVIRLLEAQHTYHARFPAKLIYDQAAGAGRTRRLIAQLTQQQTQLAARIPPSTVSGRFGPEDFSFTASGALRCPAERTTLAHCRPTGREATIYEFPPTTCRDCPLWGQCRDPKAKASGPRRVFISDFQEEIRQAQAYNQSDDFHKEMKQRSLVERVIFMLTHYDHARYATRRGLQRADFQAKMAATARNLRTWLALLDRKQASGRATI